MIGKLSSKEGYANDKDGNFVEDSEGKQGDDLPSRVYSALAWTLYLNLNKC